MEYWSILGICLVGFVFYRFINELGKTIPVLELLLLIAGIQWIIGPFIEYTYPNNISRYRMYIDELEYMQYIVPGYAFFIFGIFLPLSKFNFQIVSTSLFNDRSKFGFILLIIGIFSDFVRPFVPGSLDFVFFLLSNFKFAGAIVLFFSEKRNVRIIFYLTVIYLIFNAIRTTYFHELLLWSMFFYMFWAYKYKPSITKILLSFLFAILLVTTLQSVKEVYRFSLWDGRYEYSGNKFDLFFTLVFDSIFNKDLYENDNLVGANLTTANFNVRLNQGWIISAVMDNIPESQEFLDGETVGDAIKSSFIPRFLLVDKEIAGGRENFERFTGLYLTAATSMGISIIGEAYGNYGVFYGIIFMFVWGLFLAFILIRLNIYLTKNKLYSCFIPIIFLQVIKAETELLVVMNYLTKSLILIFLFIYIYEKFSSKSNR